jgi:nitrate/nitrite transporter NarK
MDDTAGRWRTSSRLVATSFLALFAIVGLCLYGIPFFYDFFVRELGWTRGQVTSGNALGKLVVGPLFGYLAGTLIDRLGPRRPMIVGVLLAATALVGLSFTTTLSAFYLFFCFNALGYVLAGPLPNQVLLSRHFPAGAGRGKAMGVAYIGIGVGLLVVAPLAALILHEFGWRMALRLIAVLVVLSALPLVLMLKDSAQVAPTQPGAAPASIGNVLRSGYFYLLLIGSMASVGAVGGANQNLKLFLSLDQHLSQASMAAITSWIGMASLIGRVGAGWLSDKIGPKRVMLIVYSLVVAAMIMLVAMPAGRSTYAFAIVFGLGLGGEYLIIPLMASSLFGTATLGRVMGIVLTADGVAEATLPYLVGKLRDQTGSYLLSFEMLAATAAVGAVAVALLPGRRMTPASPQVASRPAASSTAV